MDKFIINEPNDYLKLFHVTWIQKGNDKSCIEVIHNVDFACEISLFVEIELLNLEFNTFDSLDFDDIDFYKAVDIHQPFDFKINTLHFYRVSFLESVYIEISVNEAYFDDVTFSKNVEVKQNYWCINEEKANSLNKADQENYHEKNLIFRNVRFLAEVDFCEYEFFEEVFIFQKVQFSNLSDFSFIKGTGEIRFNQIKLGKDAHILFQGLDKDSPRIIFNDCQFEKNQVIFRYCNMSKVHVANGTYEGFKFENCTWNKIPPPCFDTLKVHSIDDKDIFQKIENEKDEKIYQQQQEKYASLKIAAKNSSDEQLASEFHFWQLYYSGKQAKGLISKLINWLYYYICGYGLSIIRPVYFVLIFGFIFASIYSIIPAIGNSCLLGIQPWMLSIEASSFSFDPFKLMEDVKSDYIKGVISIIYFVQKSIQLFLLYEIGSAIRNKVKK